MEPEFIKLTFEVPLSLSINKELSLNLYQKIGFKETLFKSFNIGYELSLVIK